MQVENEKVRPLKNTVLTTNNQMWNYASKSDEATIAINK